MTALTAMKKWTKNIDYGWTDRRTDVNQYIFLPSLNEGNNYFTKYSFQTMGYFHQEALSNKIQNRTNPVATRAATESDLIFQQAL